MATKRKPSELEELSQLMQIFSALQEPQMRSDALNLDRERLRLAESQQQREGQNQDRQFEESVRQFNQGQDFRKNDSMLDLMARLGTNPNIDADVLMGSLGEIDPRVGQVVEKSNKVKSDKRVGEMKSSLAGVGDREQVMKAIATLSPEEQRLIIAGLPQLGLGKDSDIAELLLPPSMVKKKEKPKASFSPGGMAFGAY